MGFSRTFDFMKGSKRCHAFLPSDFERLGSATDARAPRHEVVGGVRGIFQQKNIRALKIRWQKYMTLSKIETSNKLYATQFRCLQFVQGGGYQQEVLIVRH